MRKIKILVSGSRTILDQTWSDWLTSPEAKKEVGTGVYAHGSQDNFKILYMSEVSYETCRNRIKGIEGIFAFQWIPIRISDEMTLRSLRCVPEKCSGEGPCVQPGCLCIGGMCQNEP